MAPRRRTLRAYIANEGRRAGQCALLALNLKETARALAGSTGANVVVVAISEYAHPSMVQVMDRYGYEPNDDPMSKLRRSNANLGLAGLGLNIQELVGSEGQAMGGIAAVTDQEEQKNLA